jgi:cytochrome c oxidase subunit IV
MTQHVVPVRVYLGVFAALMALTATTVWAAGRNFGPFNVVIALLIAGVKAALVVFFFMHVKYASGLTRIIVGVAVAWLLMMMLITLSDYDSRGWLGRRANESAGAGLVLEDR